MTTEPAASTNHADGGAWLEVVVGARMCGVPLVDVVETMRPLPIEVVAAAPAFVRGLAIVRGAAVVVMDLDLALGGAGGGSRFVIVRTGDRHIALLVGAVTGVRSAGSVHATDLPPLLRGTETQLIDHVGARDGALLTLLRTVKLFAATAAVPTAD